MGIFFVICLLWAYPLLTESRPWILLDSTNFVIHETGHFLFYVFGEMITMLGGSIFQLLVPTVIIIYFAVRKSWYATGFGIFWLGDSLINVAAYISDARSMTLNIIGGRHDWNWILTQWGMLQSDTAIGGVIYFLGRLCVLMGLAVMVWVMVRAYRERQRYKIKMYQ